MFKLLHSDRRQPGPRREDPSSIEHVLPVRSATRTLVGLSLAAWSLPAAWQPGACSLEPAAWSLAACDGSTLVFLCRRAALKSPRAQNTPRGLKVAVFMSASLIWRDLGPKHTPRAQNTPRGPKSWQMKSPLCQTPNLVARCPFLLIYRVK